MVDMVHVSDISFSPQVPLPSANTTSVQQSSDSITTVIQATASATHMDTAGDANGTTESENEEVSALKKGSVFHLYMLMKCYVLMLDQHFVLTIIIFIHRTYTFI
jgi:hypothetical protein